MIASDGRGVSSSRALPVSTGTVVSADLGAFELGSGEMLPDLAVAYRHDGSLPGTDRRSWWSTP